MIAKHARLIWLTVTLALASATFLHAADWPHWLGPDSNNTAPDNGQFDPDLSHWQIAWRTNVGLGYSSVTVNNNGVACTIGHDGKSQETIFCFDAATGAGRWKFAYDAELIPTMHVGGPNASPTLVGNRVIAVSKDGQVFCLSLDKGERLWETNLAGLLGVKLPTWGFACSPVIYHDNVIFTAGRTAAVDLKSGQPAWTSGVSNKPAYTTALIFQQAGKDWIAALDAGGLSVLDAGDGTEVARHPFKSLYDITAPTPMAFANGTRLLIAGNASAELLDFDGKSLNRQWQTKALKNSMCNSVILGDSIYGIDGRQQTPARFVCLNVSDASEVWAKEQFGYGDVIGIGNTLLALTEPGELVTLKATREGYKELSRLSILGAKCWTTPTYAGGRIYARNELGDVVCLEKR